MLRVVFAVFVVTATVDIVSGALSQDERGVLNWLVNDSMIAIGKHGVPEGDYYAFLDANRLSEGCNFTAVLEEEGAAFALPGEGEFVAAIYGHETLASQAPADADYISCDAMTCPNYINGSFVVCVFKIPPWYDN